MIQTSKDLIINKDNIFKHDHIKRKEVIQNLSKMILSQNDSFVLNINGKWGSGKTTFIKLWKAYLEKKYNLKSIYFSAWEDDYSKDPFILIMGEIHSFFKSIESTQKSKKKFEDVKNIAVTIMKKSLPNIIKGITAGAIDIDKDFEKAISSITENATLSLIEGHSKNKNLILEFKNLLSEIIKEINSDLPLIIFIDELDRCRPTYSIELLERIKHIFGIDKIIFIIATDKVQLAHSVKSLYGNIDTENYFRRFFDLEFNLPNVVDIHRYLTMLNAKYQVDECLSDYALSQSKFVSIKERILESLYYNLNLSLRQTEEIYRQLRIIYSSSHNTFSMSYLYILPILLSLKTYNDMLYKSLISYKSNKEDIINRMFSDKPKSKSNISIDHVIEAVILYTVENDKIELDLVSSLQDKLNIEKQKEEIIKIEYLIEFKSEKFKKLTISQQIRNAIKKIEFLDSFTFFDDEFWDKE